MNDDNKEEAEEPKEQPEQIAEEAPVEEEKDRTSQQFEKLTDHNKQLKQENEALKDLVSSLTPDPAPDVQGNPVQIPQAQSFQNLSQDKIDDVYKAMIDEQGYLDGNKLIETLQRLDARAKQAEDTAARIARQVDQERIAKDEEYRSREAQQLHEKYPELDPKNTEGFNRRFYDAVRNEMIGQMLEGKQDPLAAADKWAELSMKKAEKEKQRETENAKAQINSSMPRGSYNETHYGSAENETLRQGVLQNKKGALAEMLRRREQGKA